MSYDLMVFEKSKAPEGEKDFLSWYREQTEQDIFPPMNGASAPDKSGRRRF